MGCSKFSKPNKKKGITEPFCCDKKKTTTSYKTRKTMSDFCAGGAKRCELCGNFRNWRKCVLKILSFRQFLNLSHTSPNVYIYIYIYIYIYCLKIF